MSATTDRLNASATAMIGVASAAMALLAQLKANAADPADEAAINTASDNLDAATQQLQQAVTDNTPA